jgi:predicted XRE-type DNA-binding protein
VRRTTTREGGFFRVRPYTALVQNAYLARAIILCKPDCWAVAWEGGSGNRFRDLGRPNPEARQLKAILAGQVLKVLDESGLSTRKAQELTGIDHSDFSRVRRAKLDRFTVERLIAMLEGLGQEVEVSVDVHPRRPVVAFAHPGV